MVQIRRSRDNRSRRLRRGIWGFIRFLLLSAVIPTVFVLRFTNFFNTSPTDNRGGRRDDVAGSLLLSFLESSNFKDYTDNSDFFELELDHCDLSKVNMTHFLVRVNLLLNGTVAALIQQENIVDEKVVDKMKKEFLLELLEQYASVEGLCNYAEYRPTVPGHVESQALLQHIPDDSGSTRLAIVISAFQDAEQLFALVEAVHMPQHYIIIHLERTCPELYRIKVENLLDMYSNLVILQFGAVVYRTDSISSINMRILRWLTEDLELPYKYALLLDGSAFPLVSALELTNRLQTSDRSVYLGELTHKGERVRSPADHLLMHKRLIDSRLKMHKRLPKDAWGASSAPTAMLYKSTSGNQGIYSRQVVQELLDSEIVMELFALSKYGCCCCLEERNWIAALDSISYAAVALSTYSMFQAWGGLETCQGSMNNAVLSRNASLCYRSEDPSNVTGLYFRGDETWRLLKDAKKRGYLFARKFRSDFADSKAMMNDIRKEIWDD